MSANGSNGFLNIEDANLRVRSGNVYAKGITVGGITVGASHGLQSVSDVSNTTSNTLQFTNATTSFKATSNIEVGGDVSYTSKPKISVESNVVTEYTGPHDRPLRKYPEVLSPGTGIVPVSVTTPFTGLKQSWNGYEITMSSRWDSSGTYNGDHAFDDIESTIWLSGQSPATYDSNGDATSEDTLDGVDGSYLIMKLPKAIKPSYANIKTRAANDFAPRHPKTGKFYGSNDGSSWTEIGTFNYGSIPSSVYYQKFNLVGTNTYQYIAIQVHTVFNDSGPSGGTTTSVVILDLQYYGYEEGSGSLDTTLKSVYNVPATTGTQLEVYYDGQDYTQASDFAGSGGVVDKAGGDQNGTVNGNVGFDSTYKAFTFNGNASNYINAGAVGLTDDAVHTVSLWFKYTSNGTHQAIFSISSNGADESLLNTTNFLLRDDGTMWFVHWGNDAKIPYIFIEEHWYHVTYTYVGGGTSLANRGVYINGKRVYNFSSDSTGNGGELTLTSPQMIIGKRYWAADQLPLNGSIANFRLYSKALNADQVKELYDYQKDYFLGSKSQVTLYKGHLGVGVTEPSGQLELAGDERIQEYPPGPLSNYETLIPGHGVFCASATTYGATSATKILYHPWKSFNKDRTDANGGDNAWLNGPDISGGDYNTATGVYEGTEKHHEGAPIGAALQLSMPYEIYLKGYSLAPWNYAAGGDFQYADSPSDFIIYGSKDNVNWKQIDSRTGQGMTSQADIKRFSLDTQDSYSHFAIVVTKNNTAAYPSTDASFLAIEEWRLFGTPGPTTLDKGSLSLGRSLDVPRVSRYDVDTETPRPEKLVVDFDTTVNSSPTDISGKGNHGVFNGTNMNYSSADKAFVFNGTDDYIEGTRPTSLLGNVSYTIALWVKFDTITTNNYDGLVEIGDRATNTTSGTFPSIFVYHGANLGFYFSNGGGIVTSGVLPVVGRWYHLVGVYDQGSNKGHFYIDGGTTFTGSGTPANTTNIISTASVFLGGDSTANSGQYLDGQISNFKLYNVALEASEVRKLYNLGRTGRSMVISDTAVGIGKVPEANLDVRGNISCDGVVKPYTCAFSAYVSSGGNSSATDKFPADGVHFNIGNCYDASTYEFTAPVYGIYHMSWSAYTNEAATTTSRIFAHQSGNLIEQKGHTIEKHGNSLSLTVRMQAGETFYFRGTTTYPIYYYGADGHNRFSGHLICAL